MITMRGRHGSAASSPASVDPVSVGQADVDQQRRPGAASAAAVTAEATVPASATTSIPIARSIRAASPPEVRVVVDD